MGTTRAKRKDVSDKGAKRKRRKKARTQVSSSESSSESEDEVDTKEVAVEAQDDDEMAEQPMTMEDSSESSDSEEAEVDSARFSKNGKIPPTLTTLHDTLAEEQFQTYYMTQITHEHAGDLESLRNAPDFTDRSLPLLIRALRSGVNIFNEEEKAAVLADNRETNKR